MYQAKTLFSDWQMVARYVGTRDVTQCKSKWVQINTPKKGAREWTVEEHQKMLEVYKEIPNQWKEIATRLNIGVTGEQVRTHYNAFMRDQEKYSDK